MGTLAGKAVSTIISFTLVMLIGIVAITIALLSSTPVVEKGLESAAMNEGINNMNLIDNTVHEVASEGRGSLKALELQVSGGSYRADNSTNSIYFDYSMKSGIISPGVTRQGDILINATTISGGVNLELQLNYTDITIASDGNTIGKGTNRVCFANTGVSGGGPVVYMYRC